MGIRNRGFGVMSERVHVPRRRRIAPQEHVPRSPPGRRARMSEEIGARIPIDGTTPSAERLFPRKPIIDNYLSCEHTASRSC